MDEMTKALDAIEAQLNEMRSLKGWRLNLIRENLAKAKAALAAQSAAPVGEPGDYVLVPRILTAENGAKSALIGEFSETFDYMDDEGDECQAEIPVSWATIKEIHKKMVEHFAAPDWKQDQTAHVTRKNRETCICGVPGCCKIPPNEIGAPARGDQ